MKPFILIVEDDPQIRRFLRATLTAEGYVYHEALTAAEGLNEVNARRPDLILLDLGLPDRDGLEVIRRIRESSQMPIVVLSARARKRTRLPPWISARMITWPSPLVSVNSWPESVPRYAVQRRLRLKAR